MFLGADGCVPCAQLAAMRRAWFRAWRGTGTDYLHGRWNYNSDSTERWIAADNAPTALVGFGTPDLR